MAQINSPRGTFICRTNRRPEYTNRSFSISSIDNRRRSIADTPCHHLSLLLSPAHSSGVRPNMNPPAAGDAIPTYDFLSEFLPDPNFGESFQLERFFDFADGAFDTADSEDGVSCSWSVVSYVSINKRHRRKRRKRRPNRHPYRKESVLLSPWYVNFLRPGHTRELTHELSSSDRFGEFRSLFRMPLSKVEELTDILISRGFIEQPRTLKFREEFRERSELFVLSAIYRLGNGNSFRQCRSNTYISVSELSKFFHIFLDAFVDMKDDYVYMPRNIAELRSLSSDYDKVGFPGCCGSMDVVHVKWSKCPIGDHNRAKGKAGYPTLGFECITDFRRRIIGIYGPQFGTRNDKEIVKVDTNVHLLRTGWFKDVRWSYYNADGRVCEDCGVYFICDNGYLRWPCSICPYERADSSTLEGYFSTNLEGVRKDVECTFGILKKRWRILNNGLEYRDIRVCEKIFVVCCCLHNFLLDQMERGSPKVGRGCPIGDDGIFLDGHTHLAKTPDIESALSLQFGKRRSLLSVHLRVFRKLGKNNRDEW